MGAAIELRGIQKSYFGAKVLEGVDLRLESGKFYLLAGPNGVGKSTLMRILMRQERFDRGSGQILDYPIDGDHPSQNARIALVSESTDYALPLSLGEIFARFPRMHPHWDASVFHEIQGKLGFDLSKRFSDLSRGQKMQVAMAAAFAIKPQLLLLDEITSVLDARARDIVVDRLRAEVDRGATVLLSTNIVTEVQHVSDHLLILEGGQLRLSAPMRDLSSYFVGLRRPDKVDHAIFHQAACLQLGVNPDGTRRYLVERAAADSAGLPKALIDSERVSAEEAFIYFTQRKKG
jgi:ABC-2 type transport system ATP-binding protein